MAVSKPISPKPKNIEEYKVWLHERQATEITSATENYYDIVANKIKTGFEKSEFWMHLQVQLGEYNDEFKVMTGYDLVTKSPIALVIKPYQSFLLKTFRKNVLDNKQWPDPPQNGWILPNNWFTKINDIVRTLVTVRFLDGVDFLVQKLVAYGEQRKVKCKSFYVAREEGYYAAHLYIQQNFEIPKLEWDTTRIDVEIEVHVSTQLHELIRSLLHRYYENHRDRPRAKNEKWQWDYRSDEFDANYLGHILQYVDGRIVLVREKQKEIMS
jgi:hypothetical protein